MFRTLGVLLMVGGLAIEALAAGALASYRLRRMLPGSSPLPLFSVGGVAFVVGAVLFSAGR